MNTLARTNLDSRYSAPAAEAMPLETVNRMLSEAPLYWLSTIRPDDRPHVTPLIGVWHDAAMCFCTGPGEQKNQNLTGNRECVLTTGSNQWNEGADVVVEGAADRVTDDDALTALADAYVAKYGEDWRFQVYGGAFHHADGGEALVYRVEPRTIFAFGKAPHSQTRYRFDR